MTTGEPAFQPIAAAGQTFIAQDAGTGPLVLLLHGFPDTPQPTMRDQRSFAGSARHFSMRVRNAATASALRT